MPKTKIDQALIDARKRRRPPTLEHNTTFCGRCLFFNGYNPKAKGKCSEAYMVTKKDIACIDYELFIDAKFYRKIKLIKAANQTGTDRLKTALMLSERLKKCEYSPFVRMVGKSHKMKNRLIDEVMNKETTTDALIPLFAEVQGLRDHVMYLQGLAMTERTALKDLSQRVEARLIMQHHELRTLKPETVRKLIIRDILSDINAASSKIEEVLDRCRGAMFNAAAAHNALSEISSAARSPVSLPAVPKSERRVKRG